MISFNPPQALPYIPADQKLASVSLGRSRDPLTGRATLSLVMLDTNGDRISPNPKGLPVGRLTAAECAAIFGAKAALAGDTPDQAFDRAALATVQKMLGVQGGAVT
jgi:hypothetical protein